MCRAAHSDFNATLALLALFYPAFFSFTSGKNNIPINGILSVINCPNWDYLRHAENSVRAFKCFVQKKSQTLNSNSEKLYVKFISGRYELFRIFQFF